ncbi:MULTISPECIES: N-acetylmuramoyl-L-alanine amidase [unclassified Clostridium]|uniref:N-acetylmuramoyl-L-alanine amidase n=1 Tax=unclassified Clostridium TaxID=2614128 RepID=UPI0002976F9B|nr:MULTISPECIES: N-acetylmuramoyl-L-alanine amidase [unclassified Clostridium]EKQ50501.1 MAG: N-acetylmuramoyl-L-alanine amidase [Clostridium sp. Maddingley MBC34-26]
MNINKKLITFILSFAMVLSLIPTLNVQAATTDYKIISDSKVTAKQAKKWAKSKGATQTFINLADLYFEYASDHGGVNPAIAYVQSAKETGFGKFGGVLDESFHNPCGLKTEAGGDNTDPNAHQKFDSWDEGVQAHLDHLALYAGASGYPRDDTYDPRHFVTIKGNATTVNSLSGKWAPSATYGEEISKLYEDLMDYSGVDYPKDSDNTNTGKNTSGSSSNAAPNPGKPESKPIAPSVIDVIPENKPQGGSKPQEEKPNITSTIGWKNENGAWYYYKSDNTKAIGWINPDGNWYYLKDDGKMATDWVSDNGKWYYLDKSGTMFKGWKQLNNDWYFLSNSGAMATGIQYDGSDLYYFKDSGVMATNNGWTKINDKWYYFEKSGAIKTGWFKDHNNWYYLQGDGSMVTGLSRIDNKIYMLDNGGIMQTGWVKIGSYWYYFNTDGSMATGWIVDNGSYYYLYDTGAMAKGWLNINGTWYYLNDSGAMATGWVTSNGDSYYLDTNTGRMLTNTTIEGYKIGSDGKKQSTSNQDDDNSGTTTPPPINNGSSNGKKTIAIDPGHDYGNDYGATSTIDGVTYDETVLNMQVADKLKTELQNRGYNVVMTRNLGEKPSYGSLIDSLTHKVDVANNANADFFISIHHNSADTSANGVLTLYSTQAQDDSFGGKLDNARIEKSKKMATLINNNISSKLNLNNRGGQSQNLFVCRNANMPAVLVEVGFITNKDEAIRCSDPASQQKVAQAIAEVIAANI